MNKLVKRYKQANKKTIDSKLKDQLIIDYAPLIKFMAQKIIIKLPSNIDLNDLISAGVIGLIDAIEKYDPSRDNKFKTYAEFRIRGAILDALRAQDWIPRSVRDKAKKIAKAQNELEQTKGQDFTELDISNKLGITLDEYYDVVSRVKSVSIVSLDEILGSQYDSNDKKSLIDCIEDVNAGNPFSHIKNKSLRNILKKQLQKLPEKQKLVLSLYYYEDLNLKEIGQILEVTESRISQIHTQAVCKLRKKIEEELRK